MENLIEMDENAPLLSEGSESNVSDEEHNIKMDKKGSFYCAVDTLRETSTGRGSRGSVLIDMQSLVKKETISRRLARFLSRFHWYYPVADHSEIFFDRLDKAWAYFEFVTLPRYFLKRKDCNDGCLEPAGVGECEFVTELYPVFGCSLKDISKLGLGVGTYFSTLRMLCFILLGAGLLSIPHIWFYADENSGYNNTMTSMSTIYKGSAMCNNVKWVECSDCDVSNFGQDRVRVDKSGSVQFLKNDCQIKDRFFGCFDFLLLTFFVVSFGLLRYYQGEEEIKFDEGQQTAQDYSVVIRNPPADAMDPDEWRYVVCLSSIPDDNFANFVTVCSFLN